MSLPDTWTCHVCGEERPDAVISVLTKPLVFQGAVMGEQNVRYCNDRPACKEGAEEVTFVGEGRRPARPEEPVRQRHPLVRPRTFKQRLLDLIRWGK